MPLWIVSNLEKYMVASFYFPIEGNSVSQWWVVWKVHFVTIVSAHNIYIYIHIIVKSSFQSILKDSMGGVARNITGIIKCQILKNFGIYTIRY